MAAATLDAAAGEILDTLQHSQTTTRYSEVHQMFANEMTFILQDPNDLESMTLAPICPACKSAGPGRDENGVALWGVVPTPTGLWMIHNQCIDEWNERALRERRTKSD